MECGSILHWKFSFAILSKLDQEEILQVIFPRKDNCVLWANIAQVIFMWNVVSDVFKQHRMVDITMQCWELFEQHFT